MRAAQRLLRLYPRAWRDRYGEEFLEVAGTERLQLQQIIDIISGAIDAWLSADVRDATRAPAHTTGGTTMMKTVSICTQARYTTRDGLIGAAVMLLGSLLFTFLGAALRRNGLEATGAALVNSGFLISMMLSTPLWLLKGQPRTAQVVIVGGTSALVLAINVIATLI